MDAQFLLQCFSATLQADQSVRTQAEAELRRLVITPGFLGGCLDIIASTGEGIDPAIRKAAAVFFKNRVIKNWSQNSPNKIDEDEKPVIKDRILPVLVASDYNTKQQLIPVLRVLVSNEYPKSWDNILMTTCDLLKQVPNNSMKDEEFSHLYTGLLCFTEILRKFRWVTNEDRQELDPIIIQVFPHLLDIGNSILAHHENITEFTSEILKLILKAYKFVTYYDLPHPLQTRELFTSWAEFHCSITNMPPPEYVTNSNASEQEKNFLQISKCYKWSVANLNRLFTRYSSKSLSRNFNYKDFYNMFLDDFIPQILNTYLSIIEQWCHNQRWLSSSNLYHLLQFLSHGVTQKKTWLLIKPYFENLVSHLIYPLLCPSDHILEIFENDPHEYIHSNFDIYDGLDTPDAAALGLLVTFVDKRRNTTLEPIITFAYKQLSSLQEQPETLEIAKKKDGALKLIGGISHYVVIPSSPYYSQMEPFLTNLVFPNLTSKFDFLKAETLDICSKFSDLELKDNESLSILFHGILNNFNTDENSSLPVNLQCALAIQAYLGLPQFQEVLSTIILPTMSKLLELSNELDNDAISAVMQECVENFSEQLQPFGVDLMTKLVEQFMRLAYEINEASKVDIDDFNGDYEDQSEKVMAAIGFLNTMITVLLSFENSKEICTKLEEVFSPAIEFVLVNRLDDFLAEVCELMENSTFLVRYTTPIMWKNFGFLCETFEDGIALMYVEEITQCLQNFLIFGQAELIKNPQLQSNFFNIIKIILASESNAIGLNDIIFAAELAQTFILSLQNYGSDFIQPIITSFLQVAKSVNNEEQLVRNTSFDVNINNIIVGALTYEPTLTLSVLQEREMLNNFFRRWFTLIPMLKRVFDLKLSIMGLISLISNPNAFNSLDQSIVEHLGTSLVALFSELPNALESFAKKRQTFSYTDFSSSQDYYQNWDDEDELSAEAVSEYLASEDSVDKDENSTQAYMNFLLEENSKLKNSGFYDEDEEQIVEDPLVTTPLDNIDAFQIFREFGGSLQANNPKTYTLVFGTLNDSQQNVIRQIFDNLQE